MACWDDDHHYSELRDWENDDWIEGFHDMCRLTCCQSKCARCNKSCLNVLCLCWVDPAKWAPKSVHHTALVVCAFTVTLLAIMSFAPFAEIHREGRSAGDDGPCILFATYANYYVELNTDAQPCNYGILSEVAVFLCALALTVWFWVKARLGCGSRTELWASLLQVLFLFFMLILAVSCGAIITAGLNHTCSSHRHTPHLNDTPINFPCSELYFYNSYGEQIFFYKKMRMSEITAWLGAVIIFVILGSSLLSVVCYLCYEQSSTKSNRYQPLHSATPRATPNTASPPNQHTPIQQQTPTYTVHPPPAQTPAPVPTAPTRPPTIAPVPIPMVPSQPLAQAPSRPITVPVSVQSESPPSSEHLWPILGESIHLGHKGIEDGPVPKLKLATECNPLQDFKLFPLPCHYTPVFGSGRVQVRIKSIQEKHNVEFVLLDQAGIPAAIDSMDRAISKSFFDQTGQGGIKKVEECLSDYLTPSVLMKFIWLWQNDQGGFSPFDPDLNATLEANYNATPEGSFTCRVRNKFGVWDYTIDFASMTQASKKTGRKRMIKYEAVAIAWQYKNSQGKYVFHLPTHAEAIERMYVNGKPVTLSIQGETFTFDFDSMVQIGTAGPQDIHRAISPVTVPIASYELRLQVQGPSGSSLDVAISDMKKELKGFLCSKKHRISGSSGLQSSMTSSVSIANPILNRTVQTVLLQKARHYFVSTLISAGKIELLGTYEQVDKVMLLLQQLLLAVEKKAIQAIQVPPMWSTQTSDFALVQVNRSTSEWTRVTGLFFTTLPNAQIHRLDRIQNLWLWEKYGFAKQRMTKKNRGKINEKELFHGTSAVKPKEIFKSEHGFDFRCANQGLWGEGAYFAVKASYSDGYAHHSDGKKQMILAKVLTGDACFQSQSDRTLKQPPVKPSSSQSSAGAVFHEERYDTVRGHSGGSDIYVVYDHDKAYPAYRITYQTA